MPTTELKKYNWNTGLTTELLTVASILSGPQSIILPPAFLDFPHVFLAFIFLENDQVTPVTPGAGLISLKVKTSVLPEIASDIISISGQSAIDIDATADLLNYSFDSAADEIEVSGSGITTAIYVKLRFQGFAR